MWELLYEDGPVFWHYRTRLGAWLANRRHMGGGGIIERCDGTC